MSFIYFFSLPHGAVNLAPAFARDHVAVSFIPTKTDVPVAIDLRSVHTDPADAAKRWRATCSPF
jgi:hypothetical protein